MNHLSRKKRLYGAGKKPKVKPAVLSPPKIGDFQFGSSFSFVETLDLISDGPIEGLVDSKGNLLETKDISRGVYLDATPVSIATNTEDSENQDSVTDFKKINVDISSAFQNLNIADQGGKSGGTVNDITHVNQEYSIGTDETNQLLTWDNLVDGVDPLIALSERETFTSLNASVNNSSKKYYNYDSDSESYNLLRTKARWRVSLLWANVLNDSDLRANLSASTTELIVGFYKNYDPSGNIGPRNVNGKRRITDTIGAFKIGGKEGDGTETFIGALTNAYNVTYKNNAFMRSLIETKMNAFFGTGWQERTMESLRNQFYYTRDDAGYFITYYPKRDILNGTSAVTFQDPTQVRFTFTDSNGKESSIVRNSSYIDLLIPICDENGVVQTGEDVLGAVFLHVPQFSSFNQLASTVERQQGQLLQELLDQDVNYVEALAKSANVGPIPFLKEESHDIDKTISEFKKISTLSLTEKPNNSLTSSKYNYNNVLIESRLGDERQSPFKYFNKINIDKSVDKNVYGPFKTSGQVQRLKKNSAFNKDNINMLESDFAGPNLTLSQGLPIDEGSNDNIRGRGSEPSTSFSSWNNNSREYELEEAASPITYVVQNPNVTEVFVTLRIDSLFDTIETAYVSEPSSKDFKAGDKLPAIMNVQIEVGKMLSDGSLQPTASRTYRISALIEGPTLIDIGNPINEGTEEQHSHIRDVTNLSEDADLSTPYYLPRVNNYSENNVYSSPEKRYVKVSKLSTETFSILISKELNFFKVTEIIPVNLTYPFSAIIGTKIDSKNFSGMPQRSFDARLKRVKIPINYFPTENTGPKKDKRYYDRKSEFDSASDTNKRIYIGDWDGTLKEGWTDNPAWILYDLLVNSRYGLGQHIDAADINKWELYKIGRFCDAVDEEGFFEGVPDGRGGLEPRYSCNIVFNSDEKVFDSIQLISKLFRGHTFFRASEVSFTDDRVKLPIALFNNNNVKDGVFNYSNLRRDQQFNTVEVSYLDRFENFTPKVEVIEDEEDIRSRGVFKQRVDGLGVTSRAMARRIGQHLIFRTIKENQRIAFSSGLEALLCQPGDLIVVDDDLKNKKSNFGKILNVDVEKQFIQLSGPYDGDSMTGQLTVYNPTGISSIDELDGDAIIDRRRAEMFQITGNPFESQFYKYTGQYVFSGYREGFSDSDPTKSTFAQYGVYTGEISSQSRLLYFNTDHTGWVFSTSFSEGDAEYINVGTGIHTLVDLNTGVIAPFDSSTTDRRSATHSYAFSNYISGDISTSRNKGVLESEISLNSPSQIVTLNVVGSVGNMSYGSFVSGVDSSEYLPFIKLGSPYRFELKDTNDSIYKIDSIKENSPNEYLVAAAKFDTGKFNLIEQNISIETKENTYDYNVATQLGDKTYKVLNSPQNLALSTGDSSDHTDPSTFFISGDWDDVTNATSYLATLHMPNLKSTVTGITNSSVKFNNLVGVGGYALSVKAVGDSSSSNVFLDSESSTRKIFALYEDLEEFDRPFINSITFE
jgi:hypothetical protein